MEERKSEVKKAWKVFCICFMAVCLWACGSTEKKTINKQVYDDGDVSAVLKTVSLSSGSVDMEFILMNQTEDTIRVNAYQTYVNGMPVTFRGSQAEISAGKKYRQIWHADADLSDVETLDDLKTISFEIGYGDVRTDTIQIVLE